MENLNQMRRAPVWRIEWRIFSRGPALIAGCIAISLAISYAFWNGATWMRQQRQIQSDLASEEAAHWREWRSSPQGQDPYFLAAQQRVAMLPPAPLSFLCLGDSDLYHASGKVHGWGTPGNRFAQSELTNPSTLRAGRLDLAFVMVYLLPLVIAGLSYDLLSAEREGGTLAMILSQPVGILRVLLGKTLLRAVVILSLVVLCAAAAAWYLSGAALPSLAAWAGAVLLYAAFWLALALAVNTLGLGSAANAIALTGIWVLFAIILPTLIDSGVQAWYPLPPRSEAILAAEQAELDYGRDRQTALERVWQEHPDYRPLPGAHPPGRASLIAAFLREQPKLDALEARHRDILLRRQSAIDKLQWLSPSVALQRALADLAGTGPARYRSFRAQVDVFIRRERLLYFPMVFRGEKLGPAVYDSPLVFRYVEEPPAQMARRVLISLAAIGTFFAACLGFAVYRIRGYRLAHA